MKVRTKHNLDTMSPQQRLEYDIICALKRLRCVQSVAKELGVGLWRVRQEVRSSGVKNVKDKIEIGGESFSGKVTVKCGSCPST